MDAFYASVEQRDRPELRGKPVVVGGDPSGRGVVAASSYEARKFGVRSAMSAAKAYRLCPQAIFVKPNFHKYKEVSEQIHSIFNEITPMVEPLSLDEAYLDVTQNLLNEPLASKVARYIKDRIKQVTQLTASAGVGPNKFIAKIASDLKKPDGLVVIPPERVLEFLEKLPVEKIWGVGPATAESLHRLGLRTAGDIRRASLSELERELGKYGPFLHGLSQGIDDRPVESDWEPKTRGTETTFEKDILERDYLVQVLEDQAAEIADELKEMDRPARTVTLKLRYADFTTITRSRTLARPFYDAKTIFKTAAELLDDKTEAGARPVRLIGVSVSSFIGPDEPLQLWLDLPLP
jgi:DNA polymerase-4